MTWTATSNQPWLQVSPVVGQRIGDAVDRRRVAPADCRRRGDADRRDHALVLTGTALDAPGRLRVTLNRPERDIGEARSASSTRRSTTRPGVTGAVPFTGWALDDVELARVMICRAAVGGGGGAGGSQLRLVQAQIFVGLRRLHRRRAARTSQAAYPELSAEHSGRLGLHGADQHAAGRPAASSGHPYVFYI